MKLSISKNALAAFPLGLMLAAALAFAPGSAMAFDPSRDDYSPDDMPSSVFAMKQMKPMDLMHQMDANKDGFVTKAEFMKYLESFYARMDRDHDGKVTSEEWLKNVWTAP
jgi:Ca2+-binding EF-hand superfamily protein